MRKRVVLASGILAIVILAVPAAYHYRERSLAEQMAAAMGQDDSQAIRSLAESWPCPANARDKQDRTVLHWAAEHNAVSLAAKLLDCGAPANAFAHAQHDVTLENKAKWDFFDGTTPLHRAICQRNWEVARLLVSRGADVNLGTKGCGDGFSSYVPLELACTEGADPGFIQFLIRSGARVADCGNQFHWPLELAFDQPEVMRVLLDHGAELEESGVDGYTALHLAVFENKPVAVKFLLGHGAKVDALDMEDGTPLHLAARYANVECAEALISHGADTNAKNKDGKTPLIEASAQRKKDPDVPAEGYNAMIALLLKHGAANPP